MVRSAVEDEELTGQLSQSEFLLFLRTLGRTPGQVPGSVRFLTDWAWKRLRGRASRRVSGSSIPPFLLPIYERGYGGAQPDTSALDKFPDLPKRPGRGDGSIPGELPLLGRACVLEDGRVDWTQEFPDREETFCLHRWGWLLKLQEGFGGTIFDTWGLQTMLGWFDQFGEKRNHPAWESYSIAERIVNGIVFLKLGKASLAGCEQDVARLMERLSDSGEHLANHIEYDGEIETNNHILNDARGLYILGQSTDSEFFSEVGRTIFQRYLPKIITRDGFLREGSSHYHFLLTRSVLEVYSIAAETHDSDFAAELKDLLRKMLRGCWFFLVGQGEQWSIPRIGDVTPDFPFEWLIDLPWCGRSQSIYQPASLPERTDLSGWPLCWPEASPDRRQSTTPEGSTPKLRVFPESGWYRVDRGSWTVFWHVEPAGVIPPGSHGHNDLGSFVLFRNQIPIVVDPGRRGYTASPLDLYGASARAHNGVMVDGYEPAVLGLRNRLPEFYRNVDVQTDWGEEGEFFRFTICHGGYRRLDPQIVHERTFTVSEGTFRVEDRVRGRGRHLIEARLHLSPAVSLERCEGEEQCWAVVEPGLSEPLYLRHGPAGFQPTLLSGEAGDDAGGWCFPDYGASCQASTLVFRSFRELPCDSFFELRS